MVISEWTCEVEHAGAAREGVPAADPVYKAAKAKDRFQHLKDVSTCYELYQRSVKLYPDRPCLGSRKIIDGQAQPYEYMTYTETSRIVANIGSAMRHVGVNEQGRVGVFGANCPEWMIALQVLLLRFQLRRHALCAVWSYLANAVKQ